MEDDEVIFPIALFYMSDVIICARSSVQATVLEEMPPFPERESSILAKLKKKKPESKEGGEVRPSQAAKMPAAQINNVPLPTTEPEKKAPEVIVSSVCQYNVHCMF